MTVARTKQISRIKPSSITSTPVKKQRKQLSAEQKSAKKDSDKVRYAEKKVSTIPDKATISEIAILNYSLIID